MIAIHKMSKCFKISGLCWLFLLQFNAYVHSQIINNKLSIYLIEGQSAYPGKSTVKEKGFVFPSFFSNLKGASGYAIKEFYDISPYYRIGSIISFTRASAWNSSESDFFYGAQNSVNSFSPLLQIHNKTSELGILNRIRFYLELGPVIGISKTLLDHSFLEIQSGNSTINGPTKANNIFYGINSSVGFEVIVHRWLGLFSDLRIGHQWISSDLYTDRSFTQLTFEFGIYLRLVPDKMYFY